MSKRRNLIILLTFAVSAAILDAAPALAQAPEPQIAYSVGVSPTQADVVTASLDGTVMQRFVDVEEFSSIGHGVVAVTRHSDAFHSRIVGFDATTGERRFTVRDARLPLFAANGQGLVFSPDNAGTLKQDERDPYVQSVWYRDLASGDEFKLAQFFEPDHYILEKAVSPQGDRVAFTRGNNTFLFEWNVWVVNSDGTGLFQITNDDISNYPSFHPDGQMLAISKLTEGRCKGALATIGIDGRDEHVFFESTCAMDLQRPIWIGPHRVVTVWWRHDDQGNRPVGLAIVHVPTGEVHPIVKGYITDVAVSRALGLVTFRRGTGNGRIGLYRIGTGDEVSYLPRTGEEILRVEINGTNEDAV
jgi:hypothetical protein